MESNEVIDVSIIIPVYNAEKFLYRSLSSYATQTLAGIEIICVDDGSTDESLVICEKFAAQDGRFRIFKQSNQGAAIARNFGIGKARGRYLFFADADDFCQADMLEKMVAQADNQSADIVVCGYHIEDYRLGYTRTMKMPKAYFSCGEVFTANTPGIDIFKARVAVWNKLFRRSFILGKGLLFHQIRSADDVYFVVLALVCADRIAAIKGEYYHYRFGVPMSQMSLAKQSTDDAFSAFLEIRDALAGQPLGLRTKFVYTAITGILILLSRKTSRQAQNKLYSIIVEGGFDRLSYGDINVDDLDLDVYKESYLLAKSKADVVAVVEACQNARLYSKVDELQTLRQKHRKLKKTLTSTKEENVKLATNLASVNASCELLKAANSSAQAESSKLQTQLALLEKEVKELKASFAYRVGKVIAFPLRWISSANASIPEVDASSKSR
ncbi:MAG: glycosyltransferase [Kiritimatiellae bacterium]|nr:glycosyltransferase [Kiritimatiellia bacterium]